MDDERITRPDDETDADLKGEYTAPAAETDDAKDAPYGTAELPKKSRPVKIKFILATIPVVLITAALLELGKNTLLGWFLAGAALIAAIVLHVTFFREKKFIWRFLAYLLFLAAMGGAVRLSGPPAKQIPAVKHKDPFVTDVVTVTEGQLTGVFTKDMAVEVYAGIPYAAPPVGDLRWKEPQPAAHWDGVRACDTFAPRSMQATNGVIMDTLTQIVGYHNFKITTKDNFTEAMSEDSLYLNIWKPSGDLKNCPVLFFIHGGSLTGGSTSYSEYNGEALARKGIIVVNCAYRLGIFGYYANEALAAESPNGTTGNYGLLDQIAALQWVHDNIAAFGGDPEQITVAGESAGASSVNAICVSPLAKGLFRYAIAESSGITAKHPYHTFRSMESALTDDVDIMEEFGVTSIEELRKLPAEQLVNTAHNPSAMTLDGYAITEQPYKTYEKGENNEQALLNGFNVHEAEYFAFLQKVTAGDYVKALREIVGDFAEEMAAVVPPFPLDKDYSLAIVEQGGDAKGSFDRVLSAAWFTYSHYNWSRLLAAKGVPVYEYYFTKHNRSLGNAHGGEMPYAYGNLDAHDWLYDESDYALSETMMQYWVNFVRTGDPNGEGLTQWNRFNDDATQVLELGDAVAMREDPNLAIYAVIDKYQDTFAAEPQEEK